MKIKTKNKIKGISLIVLVITILVLSILAATVILSLSNTNLITKANEVVNSSNLASTKEDLIVKETTGTLEARENVWDGSIATSFSKGDGSKDNPYIIEKPSELAYLASTVNAGENYEGKYFEVTQSMDMNNLKWTPIAIGETTYTVNLETQNTFNGIFEGNGHVIDNLKVEELDVWGSGLFGVTKNATIQNIMVRGSILGQSNVAAVVGIASNTVISNCLARVDVVAQDKENVMDTGENAGAIVGVVYNNVKISNCMSYGTVETKNTYGLTSRGKAAGGIVGYVSENGGTVEIYSCINYATVTAGHQQAGGIAGYVRSDSIITNCENHGNITVKASADLTYSGEIVGGIVGWVDGTSTITNCTNKGEVVAEKKQAGGIAGKLDSTEVNNSINTGHVLCLGGASRGILGGIGGVVINSTIINSANIGKIEAVDTSGDELVGGLVGLDAGTSLVLTNVYNAGELVGGDIRGAIISQAKTTTTYDNCFYYTEDNTLAGVGKCDTQTNLADVTGQYEETTTKFETLDSFLNWVK